MHPRATVPVRTTNNNHSRSLSKEDELSGMCAPTVAQGLSAIGYLGKSGSQNYSPVVLVFWFYRYFTFLCQVFFPAFLPLANTWRTWCDVDVLIRLPANGRFEHMFQDSWQEKGRTVSLMSNDWWCIFMILTQTSCCNYSHTVSLDFCCCTEASCVGHPTMNVDTCWEGILQARQGMHTQGNWETPPRMATPREIPVCCQRL